MDADQQVAVKIPRRCRLGMHKFIFVAVAQGTPRWRLIRECTRCDAKKEPDDQ